MGLKGVSGRLIGLLACGEVVSAVVEVVVVVAECH